MEIINLSCTGDRGRCPARSGRAVSCQRMSERELQGRIALVTGGARDMGRAIALELARRGSRRRDRLPRERRDRRRDRGGDRGARCARTRRSPRTSASRRRSRRSPPPQRRSAAGRVDILVNNAGGLVRRSPVRRGHAGAAGGDAATQLRQCERRLPRAPPGHGGTRLRAHRQRRVGRGAHGQPDEPPLRGRQGRAHEPRALAHEGVRGCGRDDQHGRARADRQRVPRRAYAPPGSSRSWSRRSRRGARAPTRTSRPPSPSSSRTRPATSAATSCTSTAACTSADGLGGPAAAAAGASAT